MPSIPPTTAVLRQAWRDFRPVWKAATGFLLFLALLDLAVVSPLLGWGLEAIVRSAGAVAITNGDLAGFALSPPGIAFLIAFGTVHLATLQIQAGGLTLLAAEVASGRRPQFWSVRRLPAFLKLSLLQAAVVLAALAVFATLLAGLYGWLLSGHDINYYLNERPPAWRLAVLLAGGLAMVWALGLLWLLIRWLFAVPLLLLGNVRPLEALRAAWRETRDNWPGLLRVLGLWWAAVVLFSIGFSTLGWFLAGLLFDWAGYIPGRVLGIVVLVLVTTLIGGMVITVLGLSIHQFAVTRLSLPHLAQPGEPVVPTVTSPVRRRLVRLAWAVLVAIVTVSESVAWLEFRKMDIVESVAITAHRGSSARAPENTLSALRQAIADGADFAEIDVQTTTDGAVVVLHDADLMRVAGDRRRLRDLPLAQVKEVDVGKRFDAKFAGERIPTLAEVFDVARGKIKLNIELKYNWPDPALAGKVVELLRREDFLTNCIVTSLDAAALGEVQRLAPELKRGQIVTASVGNVNRLPGEILSVSRSAATRGFIQRARKAGKEVHVWTVNRPGDMLLMLERGAHNLITDHPDVAVRLLREWTELSDPEKVALRLRALFGRQKITPPGASDPNESA